MTTAYEYIRIMRAREDRIRTFMQLELEASLEEVSWSIRCYNCEVLGYPQEEYPARLLPTLPPNYEDNLQNRLRRAQKGIFPASLKMILKSEYQLPVLLSVSQVSVHPDSVIGEYRAGEYSTASECDLLPRHAAVVTRSKELETPPKSPAIGTRLNRPGVSPAIEANSSQTEESLFPPETSMADFLNFNFLSPEQEWTLHQPGIGVEYNDEATSKGRRSRGVCETTNLPAATDDRVVNPTKQAVRQGSPQNDDVNFLNNVCLHVVFFCFVLRILPAFLPSIVVCFFHHVRTFAEPGTEGDRSNRGVSDG